MKLKTSELIGSQLDRAVAMCEGLIRPDGGVYCGHHGNIHKFKPSTNWAQGGPIIERERMQVYASHTEWYATTFLDTKQQRADTALIAAMRCYCISKLGDEVEIPQELQ